MKFDETQRESLDRWLRMGTWSKREALMLICGADPDIEGYPLRPLLYFALDFDPSDAFDQYEELDRLWQSDGLQAGRQSPDSFIDWAHSKGVDIPWLVASSQEIEDEGVDSMAIDSPLVEDQRKWPWGNYETRLLETLALAVEKFWVRYDPDDISTAPTNETVEDWLIKDQGLAKRTAEVMATILRADNIRPGPR